MSRVEQKIEELQHAEEEILDLLGEGPKKNGDLISDLGHDPSNFMLTKMIGDGAGEWDGCAHQLALADLVDSGSVEFWRDKMLDYWYGLPGCDRDETGDQLVREFFQNVGDFVAQPQADLPCELVHEEQQVGVCVEGGELVLYAEHGCDEKSVRVPWPPADYDEIRKHIDELGQWSLEEESDSP